MKANADKNIEELVSKMMKETMLEKPSIDFTDAVMAQVLDIKSSQATIYTPLISKWVWCLIFTAIFALITYLSFNGSATSSGMFDVLNFGVLSKFNLSKLVPGLHVSKTTVYASTLLMLMFFIQIPILKHYLDRRLKV
tara:strand:- start:8138 stop:8551 length:414 start_codon:yes stop_codon:yes gene_type:complete